MNLVRIRERLKEELAEGAVPLPVRREKEEEQTCAVNEQVEIVPPWFSGFHPRLFFSFGAFPISPFSGELASFFSR